MHPFYQSSLTGYGISIVTTLTVMSIEFLLKPLFTRFPVILDNLSPKGTCLRNQNAS
jgi:hypothetical protein